MNVMIFIFIFELLQRLEKLSAGCYMVPLFKTGLLFI